MKKPAKSKPRQGNMDDRDEAHTFFNRARIVDEASHAIWEAKQAAKISNTELARRLGVSRGRITHLLGGTNVTIETLSDTLRVLGFAIHFRLTKDHDSVVLPTVERAPRPRKPTSPTPGGRKDR